MKKKLITLIAAIAVTSTFISAPVALASNNQAQSDNQAQSNNQKVSEQVQLQEHMPSENPLKVTSGETFVSQLEKRNPIKSTVATQVQTQTGGTNQKEELPVRNRPQEKNQAAEKNFLDADKDGECDNLGEGKTPEPKLDGTGSNEKSQQGKGSKGFGKDK